MLDPSSSICSSSPPSHHHDLLRPHMLLLPPPVAAITTICFLLLLLPFLEGTSCVQLVKCNCEAPPHSVTIHFVRKQRTLGVLLPNVHAMEMHGSALEMMMVVVPANHGSAASAVAFVEGKCLPLFSVIQVKAARIEDGCESYLNFRLHFIHTSQKIQAALMQLREDGAFSSHFRRRQLRNYRDIVNTDRSAAAARSEKVTERFWCVARPWASQEVLQLALDWACGPGGANCNAIQLSEPCYVPDTLSSHASYAFNSYFQIHQQAPGTCDFGGAAMVTNADPSYPGCNYPFRAGQVGAPIGGTAERSSKSLKLSVSLLLQLLLLHLALSFLAAPPHRLG